MINIRGDIAKALGQLTEADVYLDSQEQLFEGNAFLIEDISRRSKDRLQNAHGQERVYSFSLKYFPKPVTKTGQEDTRASQCDEMGELLASNLKYLPDKIINPQILNGRCHSFEWRIRENVLHFFLKINFTVFLGADFLAMEEAEIEVNRKGLKPDG